MPKFKVDMPPTMQMEEYQNAYIHAISSCCGWNFLPVVGPDYDGVDIKILGRFTDHDGEKLRSEINVQLKSTSNLKIEKGIIKYPLEVKNYNLLCGSNFMIPRYLFILDVDKDPKNWGSFKDDFFVLSRKCYWLSLRDREKSKNKSTVTLSIPETQVLDQNTLNHIMKIAAKGGSL